MKFAEAFSSKGITKIEDNFDKGQVLSTNFCKQLNMNRDYFLKGVLKRNQAQSSSILEHKKHELRQRF